MYPKRWPLATAAFVVLSLTYVGSLQADECAMILVEKANPWWLSMTELLKPEKAEKYETYYVYDESAIGYISERWKEFGPKLGVFIAEDVSDKGAVIVANPEEFKQLNVQVSNLPKVGYDFHIYAAVPEELPWDTSPLFVVSDYGKSAMATADISQCISANEVSSLLEQARSQ